MNPPPSFDSWGRLVTRVGLDDGKGHLSFNKAMTLVAMVTFVYCVVTRREPAWTLLSFGIVVIGAGFGLKGYLGGVKQNRLEALSRVNTELKGDLAEMAKAVAARRNAAGGFESSGKVPEPFND
jgi:hypothetical protein